MHICEALFKFIFTILSVWYSFLLSPDANVVPLWSTIQKSEFIPGLDRTRHLIYTSGSPTIASASSHITTGASVGNKLHCIWLFINY